MNKEYIGDGVYAEAEPSLGALVFTTENGVEVTKQIILKPDVLEALEKYIERQKR